MVVSTAFGCTDTSIIVTVNVLPGVSAMLFSNDTSAIVIASGGTPGYTYLWMPGGDTTDIITVTASGIYTVTVTDAIGCTWTGSIYIGPFGLDVLTNNNAAILIYPNPAKDILFVESKGKNIQRIRLINTIGQIMIDEIPNNTETIQIKTSGLPSGIYLLHIEVQEGIISKKISIGN